MVATPAAALLAISSPDISSTAPNCVTPDLLTEKAVGESADSALLVSPPPLRTTQQAQNAATENICSSFAATLNVHVPATPVISSIDQVQAEPASLVLPLPLRTTQQTQDAASESISSSFAATLSEQVRLASVISGTDQAQAESARPLSPMDQQTIQPALDSSAGRITNLFTPGLVAQMPSVRGVSSNDPAPTQAVPDAQKSGETRTVPSDAPADLSAVPIPLTIVSTFQPVVGSNEQGLVAAVAPERTPAPSPAAVVQNLSPPTKSLASATSPVQAKSVASIAKELGTILQDGNSGRSKTAFAAVEIARNQVRSQLTLANGFNDVHPFEARSTRVLNSDTPVGEPRADQSAKINNPTTHTQENSPSASATHAASSDTPNDPGGKADSGPCSNSNSRPAAPETEKSGSATLSDSAAAATAAQVDAAQPSQMAATVVPQAVPTAQPADMQSHSTADAPPASAPATPPPSFQPHSSDVGPTRFVNEAQISGAANQSEMKIAMQTDKLGAIELHARVSGDQVGAAIIVEKRDAHAALAAELPALQQALSAKQLRVDQVALTHGSLQSSSGQHGSSPQSGHREGGQTPRGSSGWCAHTFAPAAWFVPEQGAIFDTQGRLSVQA